MEEVTFSNDQASLTSNSAERVEDHRFGLRIGGRSRLVENKDRRVPQKRAGDGDALALAAGDGRKTWA